LLRKWRGLLHSGDAVGPITRGKVVSVGKSNGKVVVEMERVRRRLRCSRVAASSNGQAARNASTFGG